MGYQLVVGILCLAALANAKPSIFMGMHIHGGQQQLSNVNSIGLCLAVCAREQCAGFDFNSDTKTCWLHTDASECGPFVTKPQCDHYRFIFSCDDSIFTELNKLVQFDNHHVQGGTQRTQVTALKQCYALCKISTQCLSFDWDARFGHCWLHDADTGCGRLQNKEGCTHYRVKTTCDAACASYTFQDFFGYNRPGGALIASQVKFEQCQAICNMRPECKMVDWNINDETCWEHTTEGVPRENQCCRHSRKTCSGPATSRPPTTLPPTEPPTTTQGVTNPPIIIPGGPNIDDTGKCPGELQAFKEMRRNGGTPIGGIFTAEACKQWCLDPANQCFAVDFNTMTSSLDRCYAHDAAFDSTDAAVESNACCTQFRKVSCAFKMCIQHPEKAVTEAQTLGGGPLSIFPAKETEVNIDPSNMAALDPSIFKLVPCEGSCMVTTRYHMDANGDADIFQQQYMSRDCNNFVSAARNPNKNCHSIGPARGVAGEVRTSCTCSGDKCNAFGNTITRDCVAYYPLDCDTLDLTQNRRNGEAFNMEFEGDDVAKNWSAKFNGAGYIQIKSFANVVLGSFGGPPDYLVGPFFTVSVWFKLTEVTANDMTLISNGVRNQASLEIYTMPVDSNTRLMVGTVDLNGTPYTVVKEAKYNVWTNLMLMVTTNPMQNEYVIRMILTEAGGFPVEAETLTGIQANTINIPRVTQQRNPICVGKQYVPSDPTNQNSLPIGGEFYKGLMDELYIFGVNLNEVQQKSVRGVSYDPRRFNA